ncbi:hypothetical protein [Rhodovulum marinum]|uniref:Uncharacterized protein n=1 Tax=Rhodovulum marinum TaxID=320662 RepID=A0A4R2Q2T7_9RHOB|nr:hypothetical protein [Rhodovulum marinum]TCP43013.1 hypothetical protein EV662_102205 [Rhodovulum marinum]
MAQDRVWVSAIKTDSSLVKGLEKDESEPGWVALNERRDPAEQDLPVHLYGKYRDDPLKDLPPLFMGGSGISMSGQIAAPMLNFDLGRTLLLPLRILLADRTTEIGAERAFYTIPRYHVFEALAPEDSPALRQSEYDDAQWLLPRAPKDGDVAVKPQALEAPAIWFDSRLINGFFMSGPLVAALQEAGVARYWQLFECRVV